MGEFAGLSLVFVCCIDHPLQQIVGLCVRLIARALSLFPLDDQRHDELLCEV